ncbi:MAG: DegV family protein [Chloroflexi bacterium]|nr:DegV family protein [Chloroflexota bacterium]
MPQIAIVTDTDSSLPAEVAARYNIRLVPISIQFGSETYKTGVDIDDVTLFRQIDKEGRLPTTAAPAPGEFAEAYQAAFDAGAASVICFCVSSKVSSAYTAAQSACDLLPGCDVTVVDSNSLSMGQGFMALAAAEAIDRRASKHEAIRCANAVRERTHLYAALSTLKYLAMSGRVGHLAAGMATLLDVKPILTMQDGKLDLLERVRTQKRAWARLVELSTSTASNKRIERMALLHVNAREAACLFQEQLCASLPCPGSVMVVELTPGLSVHAGSGVVGVAFETGE